MGLNFLIFWMISTCVVISITFAIFQIDHKYTNGTFRETFSEGWLFFIIIIIVPFVNLLMCLLIVAVYITGLTAIKINEHNLSGDRILKKIFFIKDDK